MNFSDTDPNVTFAFRFDSPKTRNRISGKTSEKKKKRLLRHSRRNSYLK